MQDLLRSGAEVDSSAAARELEQTLGSFHMVRVGRVTRPPIARGAHCVLDVLPDPYATSGPSQVASFCSCGAWRTPPLSGARRRRCTLPR
jgi:hypothetical protein